MLFWTCLNGGYVDLNLETLKDEIVRYLDNSDFAVFRSHAGGLEGLPIISWETDRFPDYRMFLDAAKKAGEKLICFATREITEEEVDEALEELDGAELTREERREFETRIRNARHYVGVTCSLELAFDHNSHLYVYELRPDWYEDFLEALDELTSVLPVSDDSGTDRDGLGGFYSNN